jgi:hypothetical protein
MNEHLTLEAIRSDVDWVVKAPPLLAEGPLFLFEEDIPNLPNDVLAPLLAVRDGKLGGYFEALALTLFSNHSRYRVIANNFPLHHDGRTLGEIDLLLADELTGKTLHLELALKFYLWTSGNDTESGWIGAGLHDFFPKKLHRLLDHQLPLPHIAKALGVWPDGLPFPDDDLLWMPGRLYLPRDESIQSIQDCHSARLPLPLNPNLAASYWCEQAGVEQESLQALSKAEWMTGVSRQPLLRALPAQFQALEMELPLYVLPNDWQTAAQQAMKHYYQTL